MMHPIRKRWIRFTALSLFLTFPGLGMRGADGEVPQQTPREHQLDLESFEQVWKTVFEKHYDPAWGGVDWPALHDEFLPGVEAANSRQEARAAIQTMLSRLKLTHFAIIPSEAYGGLDPKGSGREERGVTGIQLRVVDLHALVTSVDPGSAAASAGIKPGWEILKIGNKDISSRMTALAGAFDGKSTKELVLTNAVAGALEGDCGDVIDVTFLDGAGRSVTHSLRTAEPRGTKFQFGNLPPVRVWFERKILAGGIGYFAFDIFIAPAILMPAFNDAMKEFLEAPGLIIDLRGNGGGQGEIACGMAGWLIQENGVDLGMIQTRQQAVRMIVRPRPEVYRGPVAVLVDGLSLCGSEVFAAGLRDHGRARIFGTPTGGAALGGNIEKLPNGDGFMYAFASYITARGKTIEGTGLIPDVLVKHTREDLLEGRDLMMQAAINWIRKQE